jgi:hypothetical protein
MDRSVGNTNSGSNSSSSSSSSSSSINRGNNSATLTPSRSKLLLEAYKEKMSILKTVRVARKEIASKKIAPNTPVRYVNKKKIPKVDERWWEKNPTIAGEAMNSSQNKLSSQENFTEIMRMHLDSQVRYQNTGDFCDESSKARARVLLMNSTYSELNTPQRSADFRSSVEWRLQLRPKM